MTDYISDIINIIENYKDDEDTVIEYDDILDLNNYIYENLKFVYTDFDIDIFKNTMNKLLNQYLF